MKYAIKAGSIGVILFALLISINGAQAATPELLYSFKGGNDGADPASQLVQGTDGAYYGTTVFDGANGYGTVFKYSQGKLTTLASFDYNTKGGLPYAGLIQGADGNFYGTTYYGGAGGYGTIFKMKPNGNITVLASLNGTTMGAYIYAPLIQGADGFFYGVANQGGANGYGTIFRVKPNGNFTVLKSFDSVNTGAYPYAGLIQLSDGNLYGTAYTGGANGNGTVFRVKTNGGSFKVLASFDYTTMGGKLYAPVTLGPQGFLYSLAYAGGPAGWGTLFSISPTTSAVRILAAFDNTTNGTEPFAERLVVVGNTLYGTTYLGGSGGYGTLFSYDVTGVGSFTTLVSFDSTTGNPAAGVILGSDGFFYGTTYSGARNGDGGLFRLAK